MAVKSTVYKCELQVNDLDRHYYQTHALTLARHPSETDERMMVRLLAFALNADPALEFGRGLSAEDEPDLWRRDLTGVIELWIEVGLPDVKSLRRAAGRARQVIVYAYGRAATPWWSQNRADLGRIENLEVVALGAETTQALAALANRGMRLQCMIQDSAVSISDDETTIEVERTSLDPDHVVPRGGARRP